MLHCRESSELEGHASMHGSIRTRWATVSHKMLQRWFWTSRVAGVMERHPLSDVGGSCPSGTRGEVSAHTFSSGTQTIHLELATPLSELLFRSVPASPQILASPSLRGCMGEKSESSLSCIEAKRRRIWARVHFPRANDDGIGSYLIPHEEAIWHCSCAWDIALVSVF